MKQTQGRPALAVAALMLAAQAAAAQDRSEEYEAGYNDGYHDALCSVLEEFFPMLVLLGPMTADPELSMADIYSLADECGFELSGAAREPTPEPVDPRCERLAALIDPLEAEIDRLLAAPTDTSTELELLQARSRRNDIDGEMRRAGC